jgi:hypothetical protein
LIHDRQRLSRRGCEADLHDAGAVAGECVRWWGVGTINASIMGRILTVADQLGAAGQPARTCSIRSTCRMVVLGIEASSEESEKTDCVVSAPLVPGKPSELPANL